MIDIPFMRFLPIETRVIIARVLLALVALALIWLLRGFVTRLVLGPIRRMIEKNPRLAVWLPLLDILELPVRMLVVALGLHVSVSILATDRETTGFFLNLARTFVILAFTIGLYRLVDQITTSSVRIRRVTGLVLDDQLVPFVATALRVVIIALALVIILQEWDYDVNGLLAGLGLGGLAFSLAAQDTIANLFAFSTIVSDRPFVVGEYIKTPHVEGIVDQIGSRTTRIRQLNQAYVTIPNKKLAEEAVINWSRLTKRRLEFMLGVTYDTSAAQMRELVGRIRAMLLAHEKVNPDSVLVHFIEFGDSSLDIIIIAEFFEPNMNLFRGVMEEVNLNIMDILEDMGLSVAFPSRSLYIENMVGWQPAQPGHDAQPLPDHERDSLPPTDPAPDLLDSASPEDEREEG
jgi:MscS family membrane protein